MFDNKSGIATYIILPSAITSISIYLIGGWDMKKPDWCSIDIFSWLIIFLLTFIICISPFPKKTKHSFNSQPPHFQSLHFQPLHSQPPHFQSNLY